MEEKPNKIYDLEERTYQFAKAIVLFCKKIPKTIISIEHCKQLIRSSGSIGANYIEANESLGRKDFLMRVKICRKEAKETRYWLQLLDINDQNLESERLNFIKESSELMKIFGSIIEKSK